MLCPLSSIVGIENNTSRSRSRRCSQSFGNQFSFFQSFFVEYRVKQFIQTDRINTENRCFFIDHSLTKHINSNFHHCSTGTFTITGLQEPQFTFLYGKFHILHVFIVIFEFCLDSVQFFINRRHCFFHRRIFCNTFSFGNIGQYCPTLRTFFCNLLWSTDTGHYILALCIDQVFSNKNVFTCSSIAAKANTCCRSFAHITKYHCLNINGSSPLCRNSFHFAVKNSAVVHPRVEYRANSSPKLFVSRFREIFTCLFQHSSFKFSHKFFQIVHRKLSIKFNTFGFLHMFDNFFERIDIIFVYRLHT